MKPTLIILATLYLVARSFGKVTVQYFSDTTCTNLVTQTPFNGVANPLVMQPNQCMKVSVSYYSKYATCSDKVDMTLYTNDQCTDVSSTQNANNPFTLSLCYNTQVPAGSASLKVTCEKTASSAVLRTAADAVILATMAALLSMSI
jgi:hypothetical protein